jgi:glycosyltransferase involved in cell wall biosynthesis
MNDSPLVSILINNHNYGRFLGIAIDSALSQTYPSTQVIVVDDGSTDSSREVIAGYRDQITAVLQENAGQSSALNTGFAASQGQIICFLDSDDVWAPSKVQQVVAAFRAHPEAAWLRHKLEVVDKDLNPIGAQIPRFRGSAPIPPNPHLYLERMVTVSTSALALQRDVATHILPIPERDLQDDRSTHVTNWVYDADAYISAMLGTEKVWGYSLDQVLGYYRRHDSQRFGGSADAARVIERQIQIAQLMSQVWAAKTGLTYIPTSVYKHQLIVATLRGRRLWAKERRSSLAKGLWQTRHMVRRTPRLALRQAVALFYAFVAPHRWLQRLQRGLGLFS